VVTEALRGALQSGARELMITFVVVSPDERVEGDAEAPVLEFEGLQLATFDD
jgi:hypothetical protein